MKSENSRGFSQREKLKISDGRLKTAAMSSDNSNSETSGDKCDSSVGSYDNTSNQGPLEFAQISTSLASADINNISRPPGQIGILPLERQQSGAGDHKIDTDSDGDGDLLVGFPTRRQLQQPQKQNLSVFAKMILQNKNRFGHTNHNDPEPPTSTPTQQQLIKRQQSPKTSVKSAPFGKQRMNAGPPSNTVHVRCRSGKGSSSTDPVLENDAATSAENSEHVSSFQSLLLTASIEHAHEGSIFAMNFSPNGKYLATGGEDGKILLWEVAPPQHKQSRSASYQHRNVALRPSGSSPMGTEIQLLSAQPVAVFDEHRAEVVSLSWSKQQATDANDPFLLSASLDKTVRLWHVSRPGALHIFQHADMVTCVDFHPTNDSFFISGGFDLKLRCWSIPNGRVKAWAQTPDIITAVQFSPNGNMVVAGLMRGQVYFYMTDGMKYYTQLESKNRRGRASDGRKVTGLVFRGNAESLNNRKGLHRRCTSTDSQTTSSFAVTARADYANHTPMRGRTYSDQSTPSNIGGGLSINSGSRRLQDHLLVTTNDSRLRLYEMDGFCAIQKYKGALNTKMQIKASFSETGIYMICGSETGVVHIWESLLNHEMSLKAKAAAHKKVDRSNPCASFDPYHGTSSAGQRAVTEALFVPSSCVKRAFMNSKLFPTLHSLDQFKCDFGSSMIVTSDDEGTIKIFLKRAPLDIVIRASGPSGSPAKQIYSHENG